MFFDFKVAGSGVFHHRKAWAVLLSLLALLFLAFECFYGVGAISFGYLVSTTDLLILSVNHLYFYLVPAAVLILLTTLVCDVLKRPSELLAFGSRKHLGRILWTSGMIVACTCTVTVCLVLNAAALFLGRKPENSVYSWFYSQTGVSCPVSVFQVELLFFVKMLLFSLVVCQASIVCLTAWHNAALPIILFLLIGCCEGMGYGSVPIFWGFLPFSAGSLLNTGKMWFNYLAVAAEYLFLILLGKFVLNRKDFYE